MRSIGIIGAGQAGIVLAAELARTGHDVTLYSDRTPEDYLCDRGRPMACLFGDQVGYERELGLNFWDGQAPAIERAHLDVCTTDPLVAFSVDAPFRQPALAVDQRLKFAYGMRELDRRGVRIVVEKIKSDRYDEVAAEHDLAVVTTGQQEQSIFARDPARSVHDQPQRRLFMINIQDHGVADHHTAKFSLIPGVAEVFWIPFFDKDAGVSTSVLVEALPDGPADRFSGIDSAEQGLELLRGLVHDLMPWEADALTTAAPTSPVTYLKGQVVPTVRRPVGVLPSGRHVLGIGDAVVANDPLSAQGANNATRMARFFAGQLTERGDRPFDAEWLTGRFDQFWTYGCLVNEFSTVMLAPLRGFQRNLMVAASRRPEIGAELFGGFEDPATLFPWFVDAKAAREFLAGYGIGSGDILGYKLAVLRKVLWHKLTRFRRR